MPDEKQTLHDSRHFGCYRNDRRLGRKVPKPAEMVCGF